MSKTIKKLAVVTLVVCLLCSAIVLNAFASGTTSVAFSKSSLNIGDTLTVTVRFNATERMYSYEAYVHYDTKVLQYVSAPNGPQTASGVVYIANSASAQKAEETVVFKAIGTGSCTISVRDASYVGEDQINMEGCSAPISVVDASAAKSSNANLTYITPSSGTLTPKFSAETTSYSLTVPNSVTTVTLGAATAHSGATWDVEGSKEMKVGSNKRVIVVTAEDGTTKRYTITITRLAADGTTPEPQEPDTENPTDDKISVTADGKDMYIADSFDTENLPEGYTVDVYDYNGKEVPCIKKGNAVLLFLTSLDGQNGGFFRVLEDGSFTAFVGFNSQSLFYEALKPDRIPDGYSEIELDIGGVKVTAYQSNDTSMTEFVLIYAKGPGGYTGFYRYDTTEHTLQRAVGLSLEYSEEKNDNSVMDNINGLDLPTKVVAITIIAIMALLIAAIIVLIVKIARSGKYDEEEEYEEIEEDDDDTSDFEFVSISDRDSNEE